MKATILNFLTSDGAVTVTFQPPLNPQHYSALYDLIQDGDTWSLEELKQALVNATDEWGVRLIVDAC